MIRFWSGIALAVWSAAAFAAKPCEQLKAEIAEGMTTHGFNDFQLDIVPTSEVGTRTVVGGCDGGTKKIVYLRLGSTAPRAAQPQPAGDAPPVAPKAASASQPPALANSPPRAVLPKPAVGGPPAVTPEPKAVGPAQPPALAKDSPRPVLSQSAISPPAAVTPEPKAQPLASNMLESRPARPPRSGAVGKEFRDRLSDGGEGPAMVVIPAGEFLMGSSRSGVDRRYRESPEHQVSIAAFAMARTETTYAEYDRFAKATKRRLPADDGQGRGNRPVVDVSWEDALAYTDWLSAQTGFIYRLPSEAEWEYAARAGGKPGAAYSTGECISGRQANFNDATATFNNCPSASLNIGKSQPVGSYAPNAFGLYDMHGNVFEWTADCVHLDYEQAPSDGRPWLQERSGNCGERMVRGGSWQSAQISVRSSLRAAIGFSDLSGLIGFRVARAMTAP